MTLGSTVNVDGTGSTMTVVDPESGAIAIASLVQGSLEISAARTWTTGEAHVPEALLHTQLTVL
jgi:hypothetical protein